MILVSVVYVFILGLIIRETKLGSGRLLDSQRSNGRGFAGVLAYSGVIFGGMLAYRWLL
jgi:hypothetical protein